MLSEEIKSCPLCPSEEPLPLKDEVREFTYKGKKVMAKVYFYECHTCGEAFTTTESDTVSLENIYSAYNDLYN